MAGNHFGARGARADSGRAHGSVRACRWIPAVSRRLRRLGGDKWADGLPSARMSDYPLPTMSNDRPEHLPPGAHLGDHFKVEGLVRLSEGRMFYLMNDAREDRAQRTCWECGHVENARSRGECVNCGAPLRDRRFLVSARWDAEHFDAYEAFHRLGLQHPGLSVPVAVVRHEGQLFSAIPYNGEGLMLDEAAPLSNQRILDLGQRVAGTVAFLHHHGVRLSTLTRSNLLIQPDNTVRLFDLDVEVVDDEPVANGHRGEELRHLGALLRRYCDIEAGGLAAFLESARQGEFDAPSGFGRAVETRFEAFAVDTYPPVLSGMSDVGLVRQLNEDNWGWQRLSDRARLYVVADGMGGHDGGEVASQVAVDTICEVALEAERLAPDGYDAVEALLDKAFQTANNTVKAEGEARGNDMGTTLVAMLVLDGRMGFVANVGDSRAYLHRGEELFQISRDHSLVAKMVERGRITAEEARTHPHSNILLRTVGTERDVDIDLFRVELEPGDRVLLCSDGLWGEVEDRDLESILNTYSDPRIAARELVRASHHGGGKDNVTLLIVTVA